MGGGDPALVISDLSVTFGGLAAVDGANVDVGRGELVGLIGANGAGKSTLMNAVGGFVEATGSVALFGQELVGSSVLSPVLPSDWGGPSRMPCSFLSSRSVRHC